MKWQRYIAYLHEWADSHADESFSGMSPVCYDEWLDNEYDFEYDDSILEGEGE